MVCKHCGSNYQKAFRGETSLAFTGIKRISFAPVYLCPEIQICLDCGAAGFYVRAQELDILRKGMASSDSYVTANQG